LEFIASRPLVGRDEGSGEIIGLEARQRPSVVEGGADPFHGT